MDESTPARQWVSRAGAKLDHALNTFGFDVDGKRCADFGCSTGGFTDCLLQHGAREVVSLDTGYGILDWKLRQDDRVEVRERTNVLHASLPDDPVDLVVIDVGWTPQSKVLPVARQWLAPDGHIISLVKPHYERSAAGGGHGSDHGILDDETAHRILDETLKGLPDMGWLVLGQATSPLRGAKSGKRKKGAGNLEFLALLKPLSEA